MINNDIRKVCNGVFTNSEKVKLLRSDPEENDNQIQLCFDLNSNIQVNDIFILNISSISIYKYDNNTIMYLHRYSDTYESFIDITNKYIVIKEYPDNNDNFKIDIIEYQKELLKNDPEIDDLYPKYSVDIEEEIINKDSKAFIANISIIKDKYSQKESLYKTATLNRHELMFKINNTISDLESIKHIFIKEGDYEYIFVDDMILRVKYRNGNKLLCDIISNKSETFESEVPLNKLFNKDPFVFKSTDILIYNNSLIKDGLIISTIDELDGLCSRNYKSGLIIKLGMKIVVLKEYIDRIEKYTNEEIINIEKIYNECIKYIEEIKNKNIFNKFNLEYSDRILYPVLGTVISISEEAIDNELNSLNKIYESIK